MKEVKNNSNIKVSVIVTVKDGEKYLEECLDSIFKQTLKEIEIVAIYGESRDNTLEILKKYQKNDERLVICDEEKPGIGIAKNTGIKTAKGEFITFLDADDYYMDETALEKMYDAAKEHDVKVCGAFRSVLTVEGNLEPLSLHRAFLIGFPLGRLFDYKNVQYDYHFHSYIYDRDMILDSDARFAETRAYDDTHFHIRAMLKASKFYVVPVELYAYRCHAAYAWKNEICYEAIGSLKDQLKFTRDYKLEKGHYYAMQRMSYEYGPLFEKYIREGDLKLLELMLDAQKEVDDEMISNVIENMPSDTIIEPMCFSNLEVKSIENLGIKKYLFAPIYNLINNGKYINYKEEYERVYNSKTFKIGQKVVWLPKRILQILHIRK